MRIPGPKWGAGRPPLETPLPLVFKVFMARKRAMGLRYPDWPNSSPLARLELRCRWGKAASACALATAAAPPPLRLGASPPLPPRFPNGDVCRSCAHAHGTAPDKAFAATPSQISRKLLPRKRLGVSVTPLARLCRRHSSATAEGESQRGRRPSLASLCLLSAGQKVGARRGLSASKGKNYNFKEK